MNEEKPKEKVRFSLSDVFFVVGLLMIFGGLWVMAGLGLALTVCGSLLFCLGVFSAYMAAPRTVTNA